MGGNSIKMYEKAGVLLRVERRNVQWGDVRYLALGSFVLALACAERPSRPSSSPSPPPQTAPEDGDRVDPCDICVLQQGDDTGQDEDGCPVPDFRLSDSCAVPPEVQAKLTRAAHEIRDNAHMNTVRVVSGNPACAAAVRTAFEQAGVPANRLETATRGTGAAVSLEVGQWDGRRCED
jgi:hypothetical protein